MVCAQHWAAKPNREPTGLATSSIAANGSVAEGEAPRRAGNLRLRANEHGAEGASVTARLASVRGARAAGWRMAHFVTIHSATVKQR